MRHSNIGKLESPDIQAQLYLCAIQFCYIVPILMGKFFDDNYRYNDDIYTLCIVLNDHTKYMSTQSFEATWPE